jgi:arylsulfatase A-like enzyme
MEEPMKKPNVLWICADQQRYDTIASLGNPIIRTPALDEMAARGAAFTRAYTQCPVCTPSRASFLTGRYPKTTGVCRNGNEYFPSDETLVTKLFALAGYKCGLAGKLHLSAAEEMVETRPDDGYSFFEWSEHPHDDWEKGHDYQDWLKAKGISWNEAYCLGDGKNQGDPRLSPWKKILPPGKGGMDEPYHQATWAFERAEYFIGTCGDSPWLLSINIFDPHPPFDPPKAFRDRIDPEKIPLPKYREGELDGKPPFQRFDYEHGGQNGTGPCYKTTSDADKRQFIADYYAQIELIDHKVEGIIAFLKKTGQYENTIILYHSDHGEMLGDHGLYWKGCYVYEELLHIPLLFLWEGRIKSGLRCTGLTELVDLAPTLLDLCGMEVPYYMQGKSLVPVLTGKVPPGAGKSHVYCEYYNAMKGIHEKYVSIYFDGRYKIAVHHGEELGELYDLETDPGEFKNLWGAPEHRELKFALLKKCFDSSLMATMDPKPRVIRYF